MLKLVAVFVALTIAACRTPCPKCPLPVTPPPVVVVQHPPPCNLPALPDPIPQLGIPDAPRDGYFVPRQSWALLGGYVAGVRAWIVAASGCLTAGQSSP